MTMVFNAEQLADRANDLVAHNGIERIFVTLEDVATPSFAWLQVEFYNDVALSDIFADVDSAAKTPNAIFQISGGSRILGDQDGGVVFVSEVHEVVGQNALRLKVEPIGDYSTYELVIVDASYAFDPLFARAGFKFRPGCFNTNCSPVGEHEAANDEPLIDYLAKDFHSFKHVLLNAMAERVPGWAPTSEADLDNVIINLIAADADELSDYQDRVMNEAYLGRARKRVSLARYARLMDYHIHQGNQASTWCALEVSADFILDRQFGVSTGRTWHEKNSIIFASAHDAENTQALFSQLSQLRFYTWGNAVSALEKGATSADVIVTSGVMTEAEALSLRDIFRHPDVSHLVLQTELNPNTGSIHGVDKSARHVVALLTGDGCAEIVEDPVNATWFVRIHWTSSTRTTQRFCFITQCPETGIVEDVSRPYGNLIRIYHGRPHRTVYVEKPTDFLPGEVDSDAELEKREYRLYQKITNAQLLLSRTESEETLPIILNIPHKFLAYRDTLAGGDTPTQTTLQVRVTDFDSPWSERSDLIESEASDTHFIVETDEQDKSLVRFGNNTNGRALPQGSRVTCTYQVGRGSEGNVGVDALRHFDDSPSGFAGVARVWNPIDVTNGEDPEPAPQIIRRVPEAYRARQLRAVTLEDYVKRAEELEAVSHAYACYQWTGSWRSVRVAIDLRAGYNWQEERENIAAYLDTVRLIGEDIELRLAQFVSLDIYLKLCAGSHYWAEDISSELTNEFSAAYTSDGRQGFFHPDLWTFGQALHASQIMERALKVGGVERVLLLSMRRWHAVAGPGTGTLYIAPEDLPTKEVSIIEVKPQEIIQVASDPNHLEKGRIQFEILGGRGR